MSNLFYPIYHMQIVDMLTIKLGSRIKEFQNKTRISQDQLSKKQTFPLVLW